MKRQFYHQAIDIESIIVELDSMDLSEQERVHLASLIDSNLHRTILDAVLSELSDEDQQIFWKHLRNDDADRIWQHLNSKVDNIEEKIKGVAENLKEQLHKDIKLAKRIKGK